MTSLGRMRVNRRDLSHVLRCVAKCRALEQPGSELSTWAIVFTARIRKFLGGGRPIEELEWERSDEENPGPPTRDEPR